MTRLVLPLFYMSSVDDETSLASMFAALHVGSMKNASTRCHSSRNLLHVDHVLFDDEMQRTARAHPTCSNVGSFLESPWAVLGNVGAFLGRSLEDFKATCVKLGIILGHDGAILGHLGEYWSILGLSL